NNSLRYLEFREGAFDFQTSQQNPFANHTRSEDYTRSFFHKKEAVLLTNDLSFDLYYPNIL
ncbi:hypothetical protein KYX87_09475, partial [Enterococcus lactis]|nr:hypothetical protein [Enterococcus lactis]